MDRLLSKLSDWQPMETAPKDGREIIAWLSSNRGFQDTTALLYYENGLWHWEGSSDPVKRQELIHGWQPWPEPPVQYSNKDSEHG